MPEWHHLRKVDHSDLFRLTVDQDVKFIQVAVDQAKLSQALLKLPDSFEDCSGITQRSSVAERQRTLYKPLDDAVAIRIDRLRHRQALSIQKH